MSPDDISAAADKFARAADRSRTTTKKRAQLEAEVRLLFRFLFPPPLFTAGPREPVRKNFRRSQDLLLRSVVQTRNLKNRWSVARPRDRPLAIPCAGRSVLHGVPRSVCKSATLRRSVRVRTRVCVWLRRETDLRPAGCQGGLAVNCRGGVKSRNTLPRVTRKVQRAASRDVTSDCPCAAAARCTPRSWSGGEAIRCLSAATRRRSHP